MACCETLTLAKDLDAKELYIASDASDVIKGILGGNRCAYSAIFREIAVRSRESKDVIFVHEGQASNSDAHSLVRSSLSLHGRHVWLDKPWNNIVPMFLN